MKKVMSMLLAVVMVVCIMAVTVSAAGAAISVSSASGAVGDTVTVNVSISGNPGFASGKVALSYDSSVLELTGMEGVLFKGSVNASAGIANHFQGVVTNDGVLVKATFKVLAAGTHSVKATLTGMRSADGAAIEVAGASGATGTVTAQKPACNHTWGEWVVTKEATCVAEGTETSTCSLCGETKTQAIAKKAHTFGDWEVTKEATCTEEGTKTRTCPLCKESETESIEKTAHEYGAWALVEEASCEYEGKEVRRCACGAEETQATPKKAHEFTEWNAEPDATCTEDGIERRYCINCGFGEERVIPATGHDYENNGYCSECGHQKPTSKPSTGDKDDVPATGDITPVITMGVVATICVIAAAAYVTKRRITK